nr:MAG TPA: hypothetical protein [Caudoviricetes sp.]
MLSCNEKIKMLMSGMRHKHINITGDLTLSLSKNEIIFLDKRQRKTSFTSILATDSEVKFAMADKFTIVINCDDELTVVSDAGNVIELDIVEKEIVSNSIRLCINMIEKSIRDYKMLKDKKHDQEKEEFFKLLISPDKIEEVLDELY